MDFLLSQEGLLTQLFHDYISHKTVYLKIAERYYEILKMLSLCILSFISLYFYFDLPQLYINTSNI